MINILDLLRRALPGLEGQAAHQLAGLVERELQAVARGNLAPLYARALTKAIDATALALAQGVKRKLLTAEEAQAALLAWVQENRRQTEVFGAALETYAPLAGAVELGKVAGPPEALPVLREARSSGLASVRQGAEAVIGAWFGEQG